MLLSIREDDPRPLYAQIVGQVKDQIRTGGLAPGDELPSVRELADTLGINLNTVHKAYQILRDQGIIYLRLGRRARVAEVRTRPAGQEEIGALAERLEELITEAFHLGMSEADFRQLIETRLRGAEKERGK